MKIQIAPDLVGDVLVLAGDIHGTHTSLARCTDEEEPGLLSKIGEEYTRHPFSGKITVFLRGLGYVINRKLVRRLMEILGLASMPHGPNTSLPPNTRSIHICWEGRRSCDEPGLGDGCSHIRLTQGIVISMDG